MIYPLEEWKLIENTSVINVSTSTMITSQQALSKYSIEIGQNVENKVISINILSLYSSQIHSKPSMFDSKNGSTFVAGINQLKIYKML